MKDLFLRSSINLIKKNNLNLSSEKLDEIRYGLEGLYLTVSKFIVFIVIAYLLGIIKVFLLFYLFYNIIRFFAFGVHASKTIICFIFSLFIFLLFPYIAIVIHIPLYSKILISVFCFISILLYAPADTPSRPLINQEKRKKLKKRASIVAITYVFLTFIIKNQLLINILLLTLLIGVIFILPVTYKIFGIPYNNYKNYKSKGGIVC